MSNRSSNEWHLSYYILPTNARDTEVMGWKVPQDSLTPGFDYYNKTTNTPKYTTKQMLEMLESLQLQFILFI